MGMGLSRCVLPSVSVAPGFLGDRALFGGSGAFTSLVNPYFSAALDAWTAAGGVCVPVPQ